jgi:hypothetical protein
MYLSIDNLEILLANIFVFFIVLSLLKNSAKKSKNKDKE